MKKNTFNKKEIIPIKFIGNSIKYGNYISAKYKSNNNIILNIKNKPINQKKITYKNT